MAVAAKELAAKREREARQREQEAEQNRLKMEEYKSAKAAFDRVKRELDALNVPHDLSTPEGLAALPSRSCGQLRCGSCWRRRIGV